MLVVLAAVLLHGALLLQAGVDARWRAALAADRAADHPRAPVRSVRPVDHIPSWPSWPRRAVDAAVDALAAHPRARRVAAAGAVVLALSAFGVLAYPLATNLYADRVQVRLAAELRDPAHAADYAACVATEVGSSSPACAVDRGEGVARLTIASIGVDVVVAEGVGAEELRGGAGHYPSTALPCEAGNAAIAGHRTTFGRPFRDLDLLQPGDEVVVTVPTGRCTYVVTGSSVVAPDDVSVLAETPDDRLTLTTCHPKGSAEQRLVVVARLSPAGAVPA